MFEVKNLIKNEFFPLELPPSFNTNDLANYATEAISIAKSFGYAFSVPLKYSGYKSESSRRKFAVPNPYHYCRAVDLIVSNEAMIAAILQKSKYSLTAPTSKKPKENQAYSKRSNSIAETKEEIEKLYQNKRYEIRLDINSFFDNIYTHSIPWAIHGIEMAKKRKTDDTLLGNQLDKCLRALNYNQTNGVLVGNAVSRIVSEIILCTIDEQVQKHFSEIECCRFVDDYYIYTRESSRIQEIIAFIRNCLAQYELSFNENKIQINESPFLYGKPWVEEIKQYMHLPADVFLSKLIMEYNQHNDIAIIKYGLKIVSQYNYSPKIWPTMQSRLINLWVRFPSLSDRVMVVLWQNKENLSKVLLKQAIYAVIDESLLLRRDQELIWALWFAKTFNIVLSDKYIAKVFESSNDVAIVILLDIIYRANKQNNRVVKPKLIALHDELAAKDIDDKGHPNKLLWTAHWLLAYEATRNGWLNIDGCIFDYANKNQFFQELIRKGIKFYDPDFAYDEPQQHENKFEYVTRSELYSALNKLKQTIKKYGRSGVIEEMLSEEELERLYDEIFWQIERDESVYMG